jgi:hypothetical protein
VCAVAIGHPNRCISGCHAHRLRPGRRDREGHARLLDAARVHPCLSRAPKAPLEAHGPIGQKPVQELDELREPVHPFGHVPRLLAEDGCVPTLTAGADPDREPPAGEIVQGE